MLPLCQRFGIVDPHQDGAGGDILPAHNRNLPDAAIDGAARSIWVALTSP
jgi:hypothetical protein